MLYDIKQEPRVRLYETAYGSVYEGALVLSEGQTIPPGLTGYGVWTIRLDDGSLFRTEGRLEVI